MTPMRSWMRHGVMTAAAVLLATGSGLLLAPAARAQGTTTNAAPAAPAGNAATGQRTYLKVGCQRCHGYVGQGATPTGPRLAPNPLAFNAFSRYIRAPRAQMPLYTAKVLSDQDLADIHAFLRAQPGPAKVDGLLPPP